MLVVFGVLKFIPIFVVQQNYTAIPTILFLFGLRFFFYSDEHLPMHVHVKNGDGKAKINIETAEVVENTGIKPADLKKAVDAVKQYKADMIKA